MCRTNMVLWPGTCPARPALRYATEHHTHTTHTHKGEDEYLGTSTVFPTVRLSLDTPAPRLDWYRIDRYTKYAGELLAAFELFLVCV